MMTKTAIKLGTAIVLMAWWLSPALAQNIDTQVKTILASNVGEAIDPSLKGLIQELQSVLRYSSYKLLSQNRLQQSLNKTDSVNLPENRVLQITPMKISGNRIELKFSIARDGNQIFDTVVALMNQRSITVGGPKYQQGFLLFNITSSF